MNIAWLQGVYSWLRGNVVDTENHAARPDGGRVTATPRTDEAGESSDTDESVPDRPSDSVEPGPDKSSDSDAPEIGESVARGFHVDEQVLLDGIPQAAFMICTEGKIRAWNHEMEVLTGIPSERAFERTDIGMLLYDTPEKTMIEQVLAAPKAADEVYGLRLADRSRHLYVKEDHVADHSGDVERYARITVMPLYENGELIGAIEMAQDLTDERRRQEATEALVDEVSGTLRALTAGNLDARASFTDSDAIDSRLLGVVDEVNEMADDLQDVVVRVDQQAALLGESVERSVTAADDIARNVGEQNDLLVQSVGEMQTFSASMEEVAATAEQVDSAASTAREAANDGLDASEDARTATNEVTDIGEDLVDSVTDLGERMDDIEDVVEIISDVAEQTNLLALNANIEAARAATTAMGSPSSPTR
ncbi:PAS domain-containing methyl-accepting chemotaxis protein [Haladaptatus sp. R4]|uniref:PAS domain-containing methyl-accepting chemotaxis protein n=1 Tax=Haladaptatus sp. R4 TaxID=1679489 RepID=UPI000AF307DB|nr:PAS domain-containing methyl-accepting chemotaxis protein [Haladaptatus sp. R4]